ncbi:MAG TPA: LLM class flavin-dependent oxidoreductase, partial [Candidatus Binatia bacterium]|nr:LLM class flavin-dependent oxidoreductase [Candidatus Binatia bacterium]
WIAAIATPASFEMAGRLGHAVMAIPMGGADMKHLLDTYRNAWRAAGHPGNGRIMLAFHMFCDEDPKEAARIAREPLNRYLKALVEAAGHWVTGTKSKDYVGYDKIIAKLREDTFESQVALGGALVGTPRMILEQLRSYSEKIGGFDIASLQVNFFDIPFEPARKSMELFAREVIPNVGALAVAT